MGPPRGAEGVELGELRVARGGLHVRGLEVVPAVAVRVRGAEGAGLAALVERARGVAGVLDASEAVALAEGGDGVVAERIDCYRGPRTVMRQTTWLSRLRLLVQMKRPLAKRVLA